MYIYIYICRFRRRLLGSEDRRDPKEGILAKRSLAICVFPFESAPSKRVLSPAGTVLFPCEQF